MTEKYREARRTDLVNEYTIVVGTTPIKVLNANPARRTAIFSNDSSNRVSVSNSSSAAVGSGMTLNGNVQPMQIDRCTAAPWITGDLYAIAAAVSTNLGIIEIIDQNYEG